MRWARLLLGREFRQMDEQVLWVWDFIFIMSCFLDSNGREFVAAPNKKLRGGAVAAAIYGESSTLVAAVEESPPITPAAAAAGPGTDTRTIKESSPGGRADGEAQDVITAFKSRSATDLHGGDRHCKPVRKVLESLKFVMVAMLVAVSFLILKMKLTN